MVREKIQTLKLEDINKITNLPEIPAEATAVKYLFAKEFSNEETREHIRKFEPKDPDWVEKKRESILASDKVGNAYGIKFIGKSPSNDWLFAKNKTIYIVNWEVIDFRKAEWIAGMSASDFTKGKKHDFIIQTKSINKDSSGHPTIRFAPFDEENMIVVENPNPATQTHKIMNNAATDITEDLNNSPST